MSEAYWELVDALLNISKFKCEFEKQVKLRKIQQSMFYFKGYIWSLRVYLEVRYPSLDISI